MKLANVPISSLVPTQRNVELYRLEEISARFNGSLFRPLSVVEDDSDLLIANGHHRAALFYFLGRNYGKSLDIPVLIMENDTEMQYFCDNGWGKSTVQQFKLGFTRKNRMGRNGLPTRISGMPLTVYSTQIPFRDLRVGDMQVYGPIDGNNELLMDLPAISDVEKTVEEYTYDLSLA